MSVEVALFILRVFAGLGLLVFLLALYWILWRGLRLADSSLRSYGRLSEVGDGMASDSAGNVTFELIPITTLGRSAINSIVVDDEFASAEHARILLKDGRWWLEDCGSRNGTTLNGQQVESPALMVDGDIVGIGRSRFSLSLDN